MQASKTTCAECTACSWRPNRSLGRPPRDSERLVRLRLRLRLRVSLGLGLGLADRPETARGARWHSRAGCPTQAPPIASSLPPAPAYRTVDRALPPPLPTLPSLLCPAPSRMPPPYHPHRAPPPRAPLHRCATHVLIRAAPPTGTADGRSWRWRPTSPSRALASAATSASWRSCGRNTCRGVRSHAKHVVAARAPQPTACHSPASRFPIHPSIHACTILLNPSIFRPR
jgi:hypothetical protein